MPISNPNPNANDVVILQRDINNSYWGEVHISGSNLLMYIDSNGYINADYSSSFYSIFPPPPGGLTIGNTYSITSSWAVSSSWASQSLSASWAPGSSPGTILNTGSIYYITASWSTSSLVSNTSTSSISSSWASASYTSSYATYLTGSSTGSFFGTASWAQTSSQAISASWSPNQGATTLNTGSTYQITASWAIAGGTQLATSSLVPITSSQAVSASFAPTNTGVALATGSLVPITSSWAVSGGTQLATGSLVPITSSVSITSSFITTAQTASYYNNTATTLNTGSTYQITSSQAVSASWSPGGSAPTYTSSLFGTASWSTNALTSSFNTQIAFGYVTDLTSSTNWITCSFANSNQQVNLTQTGSYSFTQSNMPAVGQVSDILLYISHSAVNTSSLSFPGSWKNIGTGWPTGISGNTVAMIWLRAIDASFVIGTFNVSGSQSSASYAITSSFSLNGGAGGSNLITGSLVPITSSQAISASWSPGGSAPTYTSSLFGTASWAVNSVTSSYDSQIAFGYVTDLTSSTNWITCSFLNPNQLVNLTTASSYSFTQSNMPLVNQNSDLLLYVSHSATNSSSLSFPGNWQSLSRSWPTSINANTVGILWLRAIDNNSIVGSFSTTTNQLSASYASTSSFSITSSFALNVVGGGSNLITGSLVPITSSWSITASYVTLAQSASYTLATGSLVPITSSQAVSASFAPLNALATGSLVPITSSWAINSLTSSILIGQLTGSSPPYQPALMWYDTSSYAFRYYNENSSDSIIVGRETRFRAFNASNNYISNSCPVYISGSSGSHANVYLAIADGTGLKANVAGAATTDIPINSFGYVCISGRVDSIISNNPRFNFPIGPLYLSTTTSGSYQSTIPTGSFEKVFVGYCIVSSSIGSTMIVDTNPFSYGAATASYALTSSLANTASYTATSSYTQFATSTSSLSSSWASSSYTSSQGLKAWGSIWFPGPAAYTSTTYGCSVTHSNRGLWFVSLSTAATTTPYSVTITAHSASQGSVAKNTASASIGFVPNQSTTGFTMSFITPVAAASLIQPSEIWTASFMVASY